jgi:hypothetical protein
MLMLTATTDSIAVTTSAGTGGLYDVDVVSTFIDRVTSTGAIGAAQRELENIASATTVDVVEEPAADTTRKVKYLNIRNAHATSAVDVLVQLDANGTFYELHKATLLAGESLCYLEKVGFFKLVDTTRLERVKVVTADSVHATAATFADITGLQCPMKAGIQYSILACLLHVNDASTTGSQFAYNIGAAPTSALFGTLDTVTNSATAAVLSAGSTSTRDTAFSAQTTGSAAIRLGLIGGSIVPSADGTFSLRATSEVTVAAGLTVKVGSWMKVFRATG